MILLLAAAASAAPYTDQGFVLHAAGVFDAGISAPTVEWDGSAFVMFFEAPYSDADMPSGCTSAYRIGRATSPDGFSWTMDPAPVLEPEVGVVDSTRACSVNQPAVVYDGATWHLFFTQAGLPDSQTTSAGGIAYATSADGIHFTIVGDPVIPASTNGIGLASASIDGDTLYLVYSRTPDIYEATLDLDSGGWTIGEAAALAAAAVGGASRIIAPTLRCADGDTVTLSMAFAADDSAENRVLTFANSVDGAFWDVAMSDLEFDGLDPNDLGHWDILQGGTGANGLWYSMEDPESGLKAIGLAATATSFPTPQGRACTISGGEDTGDTGDTGTDTGGDSGGDTSDSGPIDTGVDDTGGVREDTAFEKPRDTGTPGEGCACSTTVSSPVGGLLLALALVRRRR